MAELVVFAGCAKWKFAQDRSVAVLASECTVLQLAKWEVVGNRADSDAHIADPVRIHKAADDVVGPGMDQGGSKMIPKEAGAVLVVRRVLQ